MLYPTIFIFIVEFIHSTIFNVADLNYPHCARGLAVRFAHRPPGILTMFHSIMFLDANSILSY